MRKVGKGARYHRVIAVAAGTLLLGSLAGVAVAEDVQVNLTGSQEVPAVTTSASGNGTITIGDDKSVSGSVSTTGIEGKAAHIHMGAPGKSGGVIIPLAKDGDNRWTVPSGTRLTDQQYQAFKAGDLYVNVHSAEHPNGEIRGQMKPQG